ncbi:MAG: hypothetical protein K0Q79_1327 [Flavipsychrobacter sp.]|jgi:uncharacterized protein YbbC (DUF1343 family)|nr:hypothetical protein [Flavipsychrobacter sp.]
MKLLLFLIMVFHITVAEAKFGYDTTIKAADTKPEQYLSLLRNKRVGLIINQTSMIGNMSLLDMLLVKKVNVTKIFVPEHGFRGREDAGAKVDNSIDSATGISVVSLYGKHKKPTPDDLKEIDVLVYDLQDVGVRFYTYISTMEYCMEACAESNKQFIVLDRPNPNGFYVDGPVLEAENKSFVGMQAIPIVYGMTAGEYAKMLVGEKWFNKASALDLKVIKCINYTHKKKYKLPVDPSPNLRTMAAVYAYPSLCLFEGTVVSVGRGTNIPFQQYGCPELEGKFNYSFTPRSMVGAKKPPYENKVCYGEMVGGDEVEVLKELNNSFRLSWLIKAYNAYPDKDKFFNSFFVKLCGTSKLQREIKNGQSEASIRKTWQRDTEAFKRIRKKYLLYEDF